MTRAKARYEISAEDKSKRAFESVRKNIDKASKSLAGFGRQLVTIAGVGALGAVIKKSIDAGDRVQKLAASTGFATETLSELGHAAELSGTNFEQVVRGMQNMQRSAIMASQGNKALTEEFERLGISVTKFLKLSPEKQLDVMADAIRGASISMGAFLSLSPKKQLSFLNSAFGRLGITMDAFLKLPAKDRIKAIRIAIERVPTVAQQSASAMALMGRAGRDMLPFLKAGSAGIGEMREEARQLGLSLSTDQANAMAATNDALASLSAAFKGLGLALASEFAGPIAEGATVLKDVLIPVLRTVGNSLVSVGRLLGGFAAAIVALISGDFAEAWQIAKMAVSDFGSDLSIGVSDSIAALRQLRGEAEATGAAVSSATGGDLSQQRLTGSFTPGAAGGTEKKQQVEDPQLKSTNELLQEIVELTRSGTVAVAG